MLKPTKPMMITEDDVDFRFIDHKDNLRWDRTHRGREYITTMRINLHTWVQLEQIESDDKFGIEEQIRQRHIEEIDYKLYDQYRRYMKEQLIKFMYSMDKYKKTYKGMNESHTEYVIPEKDIMDFHYDMKNLINETDY